VQQRQKKGAAGTMCRCEELLLYCALHDAHLQFHLYKQKSVAGNGDLHGKSFHDATVSKGITNCSKAHVLQMPAASEKVSKLHPALEELRHCLLLNLCSRPSRAGSCAPLDSLGRQPNGSVCADGCPDKVMDVTGRMLGVGYDRLGGNVSNAQKQRGSRCMTIDTLIELQGEVL
jgi:hypothetical protein